MTTPSGISFSTCDFLILHTSNGLVVLTIGCYSSRTHMLNCFLGNITLRVPVTLLLPRLNRRMAFKVWTRLRLERQTRILSSRNLRLRILTVLLHSRLLPRWWYAHSWVCNEGTCTRYAYDSFRPLLQSSRGIELWCPTADTRTHISIHITSVAVVEVWGFRKFRSCLRRFYEMLLPAKLRIPEPTPTVSVLFLVYILRTRYAYYWRQCAFEANWDCNIGCVIFPASAATNRTSRTRSVSAGWLVVVASLLGFNDYHTPVGR